ncbi:hypothetical protein [Actinophytocola oryzae]|uniref:Fibronectin type-III domain-containing protein n=1 Tax=Actinophytocola oryzae TaxID=502181 RepID=A0A4R7W5E5_9PSEU|nr:hypothetical protein [Actinophytocola oryzae]TDV57465.1 hypothetical protein CLV71_101336 [Actinophytocola oryzae]
MSEWRFDSDRFVDEVLKPVQDGWRPDGDLFRVYLLSPEATDSGTIRAALAEVNRRLGGQQYRGFKRACEQLRAQHAAATATLTDHSKLTAHRREVAAHRRKLGASLRQELRGAPGMSTADVQARVRQSKGALTPTTVRAALEEIGARELDPVELPATPEPRQWTDTPNLLSQLHHNSLWEYFATTLGSATPTARDLETRRERLRVSRDASTSAETTLLKRVQQWLEAGELVTVLRHELLAALAAQVTYGYAEVASAAAGAAERLRPLGLPADAGAVAYATWCRHLASAAAAEPAWHDDYRAATRDLRLRHALAVLDGQPGLSDEWRTRRDELTAQLAALDAEVATYRAIEGTDVEAAVAGYHRIRERLSDREVDTAIERCRPAPPGSASAVATGGRVVVSWRPSTATEGRIGYRVTRGGTVVCEETAGLETVDEDPPGGTPLTYQVHTLREGSPSARAARTGTVTVLRDVLDLDLRGEPDGITGRWRLPSGASGAEVTRDGRPIRDVGSSRFADRDVRPGRSHDYVVRATYRLADGTTARSGGVHASARCQEVPLPVTDLAAEVDGGEVTASWTPPARGDVEVLALAPGVDPPGHDVLPVAKARSYGTVVRSVGPAGTGRLRGRLDAADKRQRLVPVTVLGELAAIGTPCTVDVRHGSVRSLRTGRRGATVQLTWEWPAGATAARVVWRTAAKPTGPTDPDASVLDVTRVTYDSSGVSLPVPDGDHWFGVCTVLTDGRARSFGPLVLKREKTRATVDYTIERGPFWRPRLRVLVVRGEPGLELPAIVVTARSGLRPLDADDGEHVLRVEAGTAPVRAEFTVPAGLRRPVHVRAFARDDRTVLVPSRPDQLVLT